LIGLYAIMEREMRFTKTLAATLAIGAAAVCAAGNADAGWRYYPGGYYHGGYGCCAGAAVGAGIVGFAAGAVVGSALAAPTYYPEPYYAPAPVYVAPAPAYVPAPVVTTAPVVYQAWTPAWVHYCTVRYRSFNPRTGYFVASGGGRRFCR
jgi:hypothetical protein